MNKAERAYYDRRAPEYDDWFQGSGLFAQRVRPGWHEELAELQTMLASLRYESFLDVACGTGFLTRNLSGRVIGLDQSASMLSVARTRVPGASFVQGDALVMPFRTQQFECLVAAHFYGHLDPTARLQFLSEARRVAKSILILDAAQREDVPAEEHSERVLSDGSRHIVYKRYFTPEVMMRETGAGRVLLAGRWFVAALA
jgi:ubiquinone/menaquinone biosynthesis C-methylase UbiE